MRLSNHPYSKCSVVVSDNSIYFISYRTCVIVCDRDKRDGWYNLRCTGTYSQTTRKQIGWFLKEYFNTVSYGDMKNIAETDNVVCAFCTKH